MSKQTKIFLFIFLFKLILLPRAFAATSTANMAVSTTVLSTCLVGASSLAFGNYDATISSDTTVIGTILVTCTPTQSYTVALNNGAHGPSVTDRKMQDAGTNTLNYFINRTNCGTALCDNWGQTNGTDTVNGTGTGTPQSINAYGVIPAHQGAPVGAYSDSVIITVTFPFP